MNEVTDTPTSGQDRRSREIVAKRRVDEAWEALQQGRRTIGVRESEVRNAQAAKGQSAEVGHAAAEALQGAAEARFRAGLRDYLPELKSLAREAPDPLPPAVIAAGVMAGYDGDGIYRALREAIDADVLDPSTATFTVATEAEVDHRVAEKRAELAADRDRLDVLEREHAQAEVDHRAIVTERR